METFEDWLFKELYRAYLAARRGKRKSRDEHEFEMNEMENILILTRDILSRRYQPSPGICFIVHDPVTREIFAAPFRDRIVHHFLYNQVYEWWDRRFIFDSYSCRVGKGTELGIQRLVRATRKASLGYTRRAYVIKLDIQGYFMSLPRKELFERAVWGLSLQFPDGGEVFRTLKFLWKEIIFDDPTKGVRRRGSAEEWAELPPTKSLFTQPPGRGIVIGNLTSQLLSNIYLDLLDRFVKFHLGYKYYGRYVDDFFIVVPLEKYAQAKRDVAVIERFLLSIGLVLHPRKRHYYEINQGVPFLGAVVFPRRVIPDKRIMKNFRKGIREFLEEKVGEETIISYLGHLKHRNGKKMTKKLFDEVGWEFEF